MAGRVILLGATGFTGRLVADAMTRAGMSPVLCGRSESALVELVAELAPYAPVDAAPTWRAADATDPPTVRALVSSSEDVLVSTVGPFSRLGRSAVEAAIDQGCAYVDSTGEPSFIRTLFQEDAPRACRAGARLLPAFGYDYVPGNLAGALAIQTAAAPPARVEVGYFLRGPAAMSSGTRASAASIATERPFGYRAGRISEGWTAVADFDVDGHRRTGLPVGGSEHFTLPRLAPGLSDVGVYLGWAGRLTRPVHAVGQVLAAVNRLPGMGRVAGAVMSRAGGTATGTGPTPAQRSATVSISVARALDGVGRELSRVQVEGPSPYDLTAELLAWGAAMLLTRRESGPGVLGPVDAFGLDELQRGCSSIGLRRVD